MIQPGIENLFNDAICLLKQLIETPSFSKEEDATATIIERFFKTKNIEVNRFLNNVWITNKYFDEHKPTLLLNSHHDTVKPQSGYTLKPFQAIEQDGKLYGLGSNDAGGSLVALAVVFLFFYERRDLKYNLIFAATAEEEISGTNGIEALLERVGKITAAIVGEPTGMQMAVAEKGLMVLDCTVNGRSGHAAREEGENAIYKALQDIRWFEEFRFPKVSDLLGAVRMSVTMIQAGTQHNVVPDVCRFCVDVRLNDLYTHEEALEIIQREIKAAVVPRSMRLRSTSISLDHPLVAAGIHIGRQSFGSSTMSDKALMPFPALKMGPGDSARSHTADEFIYLQEITDGIDIYRKILSQML